MVYSGSPYGSKSYASQSAGEIIVADSATRTQLSSTIGESSDTSTANIDASLQQQTSTSNNSSEVSFVGDGASVSIGQAQTLLPVGIFATSESSAIRATATSADVELADTDEFSQTAESAIVTSSNTSSSPSSVVNNSIDNSTQYNTKSAIIDTEARTVSF